MQLKVGANSLTPWIYINWAVNGRGQPQKATHYSLGLLSENVRGRGLAHTDARSASRGGQTWIPLPTLLHTPHTPPSVDASKHVGLPSHSYAGHMDMKNVTVVPMGSSHIAQN